MMDSPYADELKVAVAAVRAASKVSQLVLAQAQRDGAESGMGVVSKDDLSPVTIADFAVQALLTCTIHRAFPDDKFVGEESADALRESPALLDRVWAALQAVREEEEEAAAAAAAAVAETGTGVGAGAGSGSEGAAPAPVAVFPDSPAHVCQLIDWCGAGHPGRGGRIWVFDPIDGTENFVRGLVYAVNVALLRDGAQVLAAVGCPNMAADVAYPASDASALDPSGRGCLVLAVRAHGAFVLPGLHAPLEAARRLPPACPTSSSSSSSSTTTTTTTAPPAILRLTTARNTSGLGAVHEEAARRLGVEYPGSTLLPWVLRWVLLALGVGNATWWVYKSRARLAKIWDHAGAMLLFEEVGGRISDVDGRAIDLTADRQMVANYGIVAAPADRHGEVLATVQQVLREQRPDLAQGGA